MNPQHHLPAVLAVALAIGTLAACSDDDTADSTGPLLTRDDTTVPGTTIGVTTSSPTTTEPTAPTSTAATTTTEAASTTSRPSPTTTDVGDTDWVKLAQRFDDILVELYADPQQGLKRINEVCAPGSRCETVFRGQFQDAVNRGEHVEGWDRYTVTAVDVQSVRKDFATLEVTFDAGQPPYGNIVNEAGEIVQELTADDPIFTDRWILGRRVRSDGSVGPWRLLVWE